MTNKIIDAIFNSHKKVSVNAQLNAANLSYHSIQKYKKKIFCLVINENELRHEMREKSLEIRKLIIKFSNKINVEHILVTRGSVGLLYFSKKNKRFVECPALGGKIVDKVGSGDTVLVYFTSLISSNLDVETSLLISSLAASKNLEFFANEKIVKLNNVIKSLEHFLK
jgi:sugar/nucleoside kinase (ribokinase family)